jgi:hypothetical protein
MKAGRLALRGQLGGDLSEFAQEQWESCVLMSIKSDRAARDTPISPVLLCRSVTVPDARPIRQFRPRNLFIG